MSELGVIKITLYGEDNEVKGEYSRGFVPWKMLKRALKLYKSLDSSKDLSDELLDSLAEFVVDFYGNKFTIEELDDGADSSEMMSVLEAILSRAGSLNPTKPG